MVQLVRLPVASQLTLAFPTDYLSRLPTKFHTTISVWRAFRYGSHSLLFRPQGLLAILIVPTWFITNAAMAFTSEQNVSRYLPTHRICLSPKIGRAHV